MSSARQEPSLLHRSWNSSSSALPPQPGLGLSPPSLARHDPQPWLCTCCQHKPRFRRHKAPAEGPGQELRLTFLAESTSFLAGGGDVLLLCSTAALADQGDFPFLRLMVVGAAGAALGTSVPQSAFRELLDLLVLLPASWETVSSFPTAAGAGLAALLLPESSSETRALCPVLRGCWVRPSSTGDVARAGGILSSQELRWE